jgi:hypothetical protein
MPESTCKMLTGGELRIFSKCVNGPRPRAAPAGPRVPRETLARWRKLERGQPVSR